MPTSDSNLHVRPLRCQRHESGAKGQSYVAVLDWRGDEGKLAMELGSGERDAEDANHVALGRGSVIT